MKGFSRGYAPPEGFRGRVATNGDIYSVACVIYVVLKVFEGDKNFVDLYPMSEFGLIEIEANVLLEKGHQKDRLEVLIERREFI